MRAHRLKRLQLLTQGVALLGLSGAQAACHSEPPDTVHINAPYVPPDAAPTPPEPPHVNAPYMPPSASAAPSASPSAQLATSASAGERPPIGLHMNATATPPKTVNGPPKTVNGPPKP